MTHLRDFPRELLIDLLTKSQVATKTKDGSIYEKEILATLDDGTITSTKVLFCGICGSTDKYRICQGRCDVCGAETCHTNLLWSDYNGTHWDFCYIHPACLDVTKYNPCIMALWCQRMTVRRCFHDQPQCRHCSINYRGCKCDYKW